MKPENAPYQVWEWTTSASIWSRIWDKLTENVPSVLLKSLSSPSHMRGQA